MNTKRNFGFLVFFGALLIVTWAYAQMGLSNDGVMFPDGSVQTTAAAAPGTITEYRIVGATTATTSGSVVTTDSTGFGVSGYSAMNMLCANEFGNGARAAFSNEQLAPELAPNNILGGWTRPTNTTILYNPDAEVNSKWAAYDTSSGVRGVDQGADGAVFNLNCDYFNSTLGWGIFHSVSFGRFEPRACANEYHVLCSAPVAVTN